MTAAEHTTTTTAATEHTAVGHRFTARFTAQAWVRDYAIDVDPQGPHYVGLHP